MLPLVACFFMSVDRCVTNLFVYCLHVGNQPTKRAEIVSLSVPWYKVVSVCEVLIIQLDNETWIILHKLCESL